MDTRYSPSTGTFYPLDREYGDDLPSDLIDVSYDDYLAAMNRPAGAAFDFVDGQLVITPYVESAAEKQNVSRSKLIAAQNLAALQISILTDATDPDIVDEPTPEDVALLVQWKKYRQALRTVDVTADTIKWPEQPALASGSLSTTATTESQS